MSVRIFGLFGRLSDRRTVGFLAAFALFFVASQATAAASLPCSLPGPSDPTMSRLITVSGDLKSKLEGGYMYFPFEVPVGTTGIRVRYCTDQPENVPAGAPPSSPRHVLDAALYENHLPEAIWGPAQLRGSTGSSIHDFTVAVNPPSAPAVYRASPKGYVSGVTTRGYEAGPIESGQWALELGIAAVASQPEGDRDGTVAYGVQIELTSDSSWADHPYLASPADPDRVANPNPGWYAGDLDVHGEQEPGNALVADTLAYAFGRYGDDGAGLDFVTLLDHNNTTGHSDIGRYEAAYPNNLIIGSTEVTTYRGDIQNHFGRVVDYRTGPLYIADLGASGPDYTVPSPSPDQSIRPARGAAGIFDAIKAADGVTQINHPTILSDLVPIFDDYCRGCAWSYTADQTSYRRVDLIEVSTGPAGSHGPPFAGPNPSTPMAIRFWESAIDRGGFNANRIAAVGGSDSHYNYHRGALDPVANRTDAPIGMATTMVYADQLSAAGIRRGLRAGHTYVKVWGADGPDLRLEGIAPGGNPAEPAIIGDVIRSNSATLTATVSNLDAARAARPGVYTLGVYRNGAELLTLPLPPVGDSFSLDLPAFGPARYRLEVDRSGGAIETISSPIYLDPRVDPDPDPDPDPDTPPDCEDPPLLGGEGDDSFYGTEHGDHFAGEAGRDVGVGRSARDCLVGGSGEDRLIGGPGADRLIGGEDNDRLSAGPGGDYLLGVEGADRISGGAGADRVIGGDGDDTLGGGSGDDDLRGGPGLDKIDGGSGDDVIGADDGERDTIRCGDGFDRAVIDPTDRTSGCEEIVSLAAPRVAPAHRGSKRRIR